jgi:hypothetical protein
VELSHHQMMVVMPVDLGWKLGRNAVNGHLQPSVAS